MFIHLRTMPNVQTSVLYDSQSRGRRGSGASLWWTHKISSCSKIWKFIKDQNIAVNTFYVDIGSANYSPMFQQDDDEKKKIEHKALILASVFLLDALCFHHTRENPRGKMFVLLVISSITRRTVKPERKPRLLLLLLLREGVCWWVGLMNLACHCK